MTQSVAASAPPICRTVHLVEGQIGPEAGRNPAKLNFGDSFANALTKATGEPLLFKGADFKQNGC